MIKNLLLLVVALMCCCGTALGWGKSGHDAIAYIAECNLTPKAKANIEQYLGHSIVYDASWMDRYRHTPSYKKTSKWHSTSVNENLTYAPSEEGDAVSCIEESMAKLQNYRKLDDSTVVVCIRYLVHLVGDMHCPTHVKYPWYKNYEFYLENNKYGFHAFWDSGALDINHRWGYMEYQHQLDRCSESEKAAIAKGTPREWLAQSARDCRVIYEWTSPDQRFNKNQSRDLLNQVHPFAERQILMAGYRLARVLNELFG